MRTLASRWRELERPDRVALAAAVLATVVTLVVEPIRTFVFELLHIVLTVVAFGLLIIYNVITELLLT